MICICRRGVIRRVGRRVVIIRLYICLACAERVRYEVLRVWEVAVGMEREGWVGNLPVYRGWKWGSL